MPGKNRGSDGYDDYSGYGEDRNGYTEYDNAGYGDGYVGAQDDYGYNDGYGNGQNSYNGYDDDYGQAQDGYGSAQDGYGDAQYGYDNGYGSTQDGYYSDGYAQGQGGYGNQQGYSDQQGYAVYGEYSDDPYYGGSAAPVEKKSKKSRKNKAAATPVNASGHGRGHGRGGEPGRGGEQKTAASRKKGKVGILIAELIVLAVVIVAFVGVGIITRMQKTDGTKVEEVVKESISQEVVEAKEAGEMKGYRNIAFFGVDSTKGEIRKNTRSDSIMVASINQDTGDVKIVSIYRDTYVNLGNDSYGKCNAAYAAGGPEQAIMMLNTNLDLDITDFVTVGFLGLTEAIDALGGIDIDVDEVEMHHLNSYQSTMAKEIGKEYIEVTQPGFIHLNGLQATAYCRIRYTAGDDFKRAARQREVLRAVIEKAKKADPAKLTQTANDVFEDIYTSLSLSEILKVVSNITSYNMVAENPDDKFGSGFPESSMRDTGYVGAESVVMPVDLANNVRWLHWYLFGDESYEPSSRVSECSATIVNKTGKSGSGTWTPGSSTGAASDEQEEETTEE